MQAQTVELLHANARLLKAVNSQLARKRVKRVPPLRLPRPGEQKKKKSKKSPAQRLADAVRTLNGR